MVEKDETDEEVVGDVASEDVEASDDDVPEPSKRKKNGFIPHSGSVKTTSCSSRDLRPTTEVAEPRKYAAAPVTSSERLTNILTSAIYFKFSFLYVAGGFAE